MKDKMTSSSSTNARRPPRNATMRRKTRRKTPLVATAACVLAASSSSVEAFGQRPSGAWPSPASISLTAGTPGNRISTGARATLAKSHRRTSSLGYREGDADQSTAQRRQNARSGSAVSSKPSSPSGASRQNPAQVSEESKGLSASSSSSGGGLLGLLSRGRRRITARNNHTENEQFDLDTYLEYIDRRYKRVHESDKKSSSRNSKNKKTSPPPAASSSKKSPPDTTSSSRQGISTTLHWLMASDSTTDADCDAACQERRRQDALEVLGLAGLASAELLRRHQLPVPEEEANGKSSAGAANNNIEEVPTSLVGPISFLSSSSSSQAIIDVEPAATVTALEVRPPLPVRALLFPTLVLRALLQRAAVSIAAAGSKRAARVFTAVAVGAFCVVARPLGLLALKIGLGGLTGGQN